MGIPPKSDIYRLRALIYFISDPEIICKKFVVSRAFGAVIYARHLAIPNKIDKVIIVFTLNSFYNKKIT